MLVVVDPSIPVYVPSAFSPNGDGVNETFGVFLGRPGMQLLSVQVYDRWGSLVHSGIGEWEGTGHPSGTYVYVVEVRMPNGEGALRRGEVSLLR